MSYNIWAVSNSLSEDLQLSKNTEAEQKTSQAEQKASQAEQKNESQCWL